MLATSIGCATSKAPPEAPADPPSTARRPFVPPGEGSELSESLVALGEKALAEGKLRAAEDRFRRALVEHPDSVRARIGLVQVVGASSPEGRSLLDESMALDPTSLETLLALAALERAEGRDEVARDLLTQAVVHHLRDPRSHHSLDLLTGRAPPPPGDASFEEIMSLATRYPYDARANLHAARKLIAAGRTREAAGLLNNTLWFGDLDPESTRLSIELLREIDPEWKNRRVVRIHSYADEGIVRDPWWRWRLRLLWLALGRTLHPILDTSFIPASFTEFSSEGIGPDLPAIERSMRQQTGELPDRGVIATFTGQGFPHDRTGWWRRGQAELLGEAAIVRLEEGELASRTLVHEVLHLYGAVHVAPEFDSLMNPRGSSLILDEVNRYIATLFRDRRFARTKGLNEKALPYTDTQEVAHAYTQMLGAYLQSRNRAIAHAEETRTESEIMAAKIAEQGTSLDAQMGKVAILVAGLHSMNRGYEEARDFLKIAAKLYGLDTVEGRTAQEEARKLAKAIRLSKREEKRGSRETEDSDAD